MHHKRAAERDDEKVRVAKGLDSDVIVQLGRGLEIIAARLELTRIRIGERDEETRVTEL